MRFDRFSQLRLTAFMLSSLSCNTTPPAFAAKGAAVTWARGIEGQRKADLGDGRYLNPILAGDHSDPSVLKDGSDYYKVHSSFDAVPGQPIWHSRDLVTGSRLARRSRNTSAPYGCLTSQSITGATISTSQC